MSTAIPLSVIIVLFCTLTLTPVSASVPVTVDQSITESQIWLEGSGKSPDTTTAKIVVKGSG